MHPIITESRYFSSGEGKRVKMRSFNDCLARRDYGRIVNDYDLFLAAYCKAYLGSVSVKPKEIGNEIVIAGNRAFDNAISTTVEKIRSFFVEGFLTNQNFEIYIFETFRGGTYITKPFETFDCQKRRSDLFHLADHYQKFFKPVLEGLTGLCGASYHHKIKKLEINDTYNKFGNVEIIEVRWKENVDAAYQIPPKEIDQPKDLRLMLYASYLEGKLCDYQLVANNGQSIKIHSLILRMYGGDVFEKLLNSQMMESKAQTITFEEYSEITVRSFVEFVYLGGSLSQEKMLKFDLDVFELLSFAYCFQLPLLVDCCTNLLSRIATQKDAGRILEAATFYNNEYLKKLYEALI